ncbi:putative transposase [Acanthamoeba polyphaga mimivirus]|nr:putative transposase [Acanthamoeba castellanii mamavirus]EJN40601.1 putative transposase [Acanthamoeba polyphaga lentillevirus]UMZ07599.1 putative transposase [Acanthamoeba polyphaga mimivirus]
MAKTTNGKFWNDECEKISDLLWKPNLIVNHKPQERINFKCDNKYITFNYYSNNVPINDQLKFIDIPQSNNTDKKNKLMDRLLKIEDTRYKKDIESNKTRKIKLTKEQLTAKHNTQLLKIQNKISQLDGFIRSRRIQLLPNYFQKHILDIWFNETTIIYNQLLTEFTQYYIKFKEIASDNKELVNLLKTNTEFPLSLQKLRNLKIHDIINIYLEDQLIHKLETPFCVIANTIKEFVANVKGNLTKLAENKINEFTFKHKNFNRKIRTISVDSKYASENSFYPDKLGKLMQTYEDLKGFSWQNVKHDFKIVYDKYDDKYYAHIPKYVYRNLNILNKKPIAVMDPGERTFQTLYGLNHVISIGDNLRETISKRLLRIDNLKSKLDTPGSKKHNLKLNRKTRVRKCRYKKAIDRHHKKIEHLQRELHYKTAIYLCENYQRIMVTDFSSKKVSSKDGDLDAMSKRILGKISHYRFRQRLQQKCEEFNCQYLEVNEAWTSKTCCNCGYIHAKLGTSKIYDCPKCKQKRDRDVNGAINILLKNRKLVLMEDQ